MILKRCLHTFLSTILIFISNQNVFSQNEIQTIQIINGEQYLSNSTDGNGIYQWNTLTQNLELEYEGLTSPPLKIFYREKTKEIVALDSNEVVIWDLYNKEPKARFSVPAEIQSDLSSYFQTIHSYKDLKERTVLHNDLIYFGLGGSLVELNFVNGSFKILKNFESFIVGLNYCESQSYFLIEENLIPKRIHHFNLKTGEIKKIAEGESLYSSLNAKGDFLIFDYFANKGELFSADLKKKSTISINGYVGYSKPLLLGEELLLFPFSDSSVILYYLSNDFSTYQGFSNGNGIITFLNGYFLSSSTENNKVACSTLNQFVSSRQNFTEKAIRRSESFQLIKAGSIGLNSFNNGDKSYPYSHRITAFKSSLNKSFFGAEDGSFGYCNTDETLKVIDKISNGVSALAVSDSVLYIGSVGRIVMYNLNKHQFANTFRAHEGFVNHLSLSPNNSFLLTAASDGSVYLWDLKELSLIRRYWFPKTIEKCELNDDLSLKIMLSDGEIFQENNQDLYKSLNSQEIEVKTRLSHRASIRSMDLSKEGDYLISVDDDGLIKIWITDQMIPIHTLQFDDGIRRLKFIENGTTFFAFSGNCIYIIDTKTGKLIRKLQIPAMYGNFQFLDITGTSNGRFYLISAVNSNDIYFYNLTTNSFGWFCSGKESFSVKDLAYNINDSLFVTYGNEAIYIMEANKGEFIRKIPNVNNSNQNAYVNYTLSFSPNGKLILADYNDSLRVFDFSSGKILGTYKGNTGFFISDSTVFICGYFSGDRRTKYYKENVFTKEQGYLVSLERLDYLTQEFACDLQKQLVYFSKNGEIKIINLKSGLFIDRKTGIPAVKNYVQYDPVNKGKFIVSNKEQIRTVSTISAKTEKIWSLRGEEVYFNKEKTTFILSDAKGLTVYDAKTEKKLFSVPDFDRVIFGEQGQLICQNYMNDIRIVNASNGQLIYERKGLTGKEILNSSVYIAEDNEVVLILYKTSGDINKMSYDEQIAAKRKNTYMIGIDAVTGKEKYKKDYPVEFTTMLYSSKGQLAIQTNYSQFKLLKDKKELFINTELFYDKIFFSEDGNYFYLTGSEGQLESYDTETGKLLFRNHFHDVEINNLSWQDSMFISVSNDGKVSLMNVHSGKLIGSYLFFANDDHILISADNYYMGSKNGVESICFKKGKNYYPIEQFDAVRNRPDLVLRSFGEKNDNVLRSYEHAVQKRLNKLGIKPMNAANDFTLPELIIKNKEAIPFVTSSNFLTFYLTGKSKDHALKSLNVWINDVPLYGIKGMTEEITSLKTFDKSIKMELAEGSNKIQFALMNDQGIESEKQTFYVNYEVLVQVKKKLYLINLGISKYVDTTYNLRFASKDANDLQNLYLSTKTALYDSIINFTLTDQELTTKNVQELKLQLQKAKRNDAVIITYAGHGMLDNSHNYFLGTHDIDFKNPSLNGLAYENLESLLDGIAPLKKVLFIDACHSGEVDKDDILSENADNVTAKKVGRGARVEYVGDKTEINVTELTKELFNDLRRGTGATVISASGGLEFAMESADWQNGLFTYCLIMGLKELKADKNEDGKIMLSELQEYLLTEVYKLSNGLQKPTSRIENLEIDWRVY